MIEVEHLTKYYGTFPVVRDVTFNVERGEILGFLGPNGAGKTTTMRMITGYLPPTSGTVRVAGFDVTEKSLEARQHLGYLPETVPLYTELTTVEYLDFRGRLTGLLNTRDRRARMYEVMDRLNLTDVANKQIGNLSRGYRQRVGLAQAMLHNPDVLILDEPTVGLDPVQITEVRDLIKELGLDHTIILSTHLLPEVSMVCNRVIIINRGRLVAVDTPIHLTENVNEQQTIQLEIGGTPAAVLNGLRTVTGVRSARLTSPDGKVLDGAADALPAGVNAYQVEGAAGTDVRSEVASAIVAGGFQLLELKAVRPSLEDIFVNIISKEMPEEDDMEDTEMDAGDGNEGEDDWSDEQEVVAAAPTRERVTAKRRVRK
ncbi:MAG: ATP-binding cassette domain-containing protein [Chloroflexota bacterium]